MEQNNTRRVFAKAMKHYWVLIGIVGTISGVFAFLNTGWTILTKIITAILVLGFVIIFAQIPYWIQKEAIKGYEKHNKMLEGWLDEERTKVANLESVLDGYKRTYGVMEKK